MGQSRPRDTTAFTKRPDGQPFGACSHQCAQHAEAMFRPEGRKLRSKDINVFEGMRFEFHISRNIVVTVWRKYYFDETRNIEFSSTAS